MSCRPTAHSAQHTHKHARDLSMFCAWRRATWPCGQLLCKPRLHTEALHSRQPTLHCHYGNARSSTQRRTHKRKGCLPCTTHAAAAARSIGNTLPAQPTPWPTPACPYAAECQHAHPTCSPQTPTALNNHNVQHGQAQESHACSTRVMRAQQAAAMRARVLRAAGMHTRLRQQLQGVQYGADAA